MKTILLVAAGLVVPLVWGWFSHWLVDRFWPQPSGAASRSEGGDGQTNVLDYQI
jgi:hypothetical protein